MTGSAYYINIGELVGALGAEGAEVLIGRFGGTRFYVPERPSDDHRLVTELGREFADRLAKYVTTGVGGLIIEIPIDKASTPKNYYREQLEIVAKSNLSEPQLAVKLGVHGRTIRRMRARVRLEREAQAQMQISAPS